MSIVVDLIVVAIILLNIFIGYKRGLTGSILKIASFIIAIILAAILYKPVASVVIENTQWDDNLKQSIVSMLNGQVQEDGKINEEDSNLSNELVNYINNSLEQAKNDAKEQIVPTVAENITVTIVNAGSAIAIFIVARIILLIVAFILKFITELPILKQIDKTGGIIYGILAGLIFVWVILAIVSFISPTIADTGLVEAISKSSICGFMYNNNLLLKMIF